MFLVICYLLSVLVFTVYAFNQAFLSIRAQRMPCLDPPEALDHCPVVTVQLPIYNEFFVAERCIRAVAELDWPVECLQIQVLDDSTDETLYRTRSLVNELKDHGLDASLHHREIRTGYKAGALQEAMGSVKGEYIAIFDADFVPPADFLKRTMPYFTDHKVGVVQTRWGHLNRNANLLSRMQAMAIDVHFLSEQNGRSALGAKLNFNGTAGIWRKNTIEESGSWQHDTLTEDLDLSYRAQLAGWRIAYVPDVVCPAELPETVSGILGQQYRWMRGGAENLIKHLGASLGSGSMQQRFQAVMHLLNSSLYLVLFTMVLSSVALVIGWSDELQGMIPYWAGVLFTGNLALFYSFYKSNKGLYRSWTLFRVLADYLVFISLSGGVMFNNTLAVLSGYARKPAEFVRTPKYGGHTTGSRYFTRYSKVLFANSALLVYCLCGLYIGWSYRQFGFYFLHVPITLGTLYMLCSQLQEQLQRQRLNQDVARLQKA